MITIGILGGMGPSSTAPFLEMIYAECRAQYGAARDEDYPHILLYSLPTPYGDGHTTDHDAMCAAIAAGVRRLAAAGVDFVAIPCNTSHRYFETIVPEVGVRILDMVDATIAQASRTTGCVGVLATPATLEWGGYQIGLQKNGCDALLVDEVQPLVEHVLARLTEGAHPIDLEKPWNEIVRLYTERGAERLIVGCTDLSAMTALSAQTEFIDAARILALLSVQEYLRMVRARA